MNTDYLGHTERRSRTHNESAQKWEYALPADWPKWRPSGSRVLSRDSLGSQEERICSREPGWVWSARALDAAASGGWGGSPNPCQGTGGPTTARTQVRLEVEWVSRPSEKMVPQLQHHHFWSIKTMESLASINCPVIFYKVSVSYVHWMPPSSLLPVAGLTKDCPEVKPPHGWQGCPHNRKENETLASHVSCQRSQIYQIRDHKPN